MKDVTPLISVCIANYNGMGVIDECLQSVLVQQGSFNLEILVHDDASNDDSVAHILEHYPNVSLIESERNVGFCVSNNRMAAAVQGKYMLLLNNDATLLPDALGVLLAEAQLLARPAILTLPQLDAANGELLDIGCRLDPFLNPVPNVNPTHNAVGTVHGACLWIDKNLWDELGGFPEWFGSVAEDLYLCCRARLAGHPLRALGVSGYRHRVGHSFGGGKLQRGGLSTTFRRRALSERNKTFVIAMTFPTPFMQCLLSLHLLLLLAEGALLSLLQVQPRYWTQIYWPVVVTLVRMRTQLRETRRGIMQQRSLASADFFSVFDWMPYKLRMVLKHGFPRVR